MATKKIGKEKAAFLKTILYKIQMRYSLISYMQPKTPKAAEKIKPFSKSSVILREPWADSFQRKKGAKACSQANSCSEEEGGRKTKCRSNITRPTTMYFERWGSLAPPPGKAGFLKNILALLFLMQILYLNSTKACKVWRSGVLACKKPECFLLSGPLPVPFSD